MPKEYHFPWSSHQSYIAIGMATLSASLLGVDTCILTGIDPKAYDDILDIADYGTVAVIACGYRDVSDKYIHLAKSRFASEGVIIQR